MTSSFQDRIEQYRTLLDQEWITIYEEVKDEINDYYASSAIINGMSEAERKDYLSDYEWGFNPDCFGKTVFNKYGDEIEVQSGEKLEEFEYVVVRRHHDGTEGYLEINPKLIWYGNLYLCEGGYKNLTTGDYQIKISDNTVTIRLSYLRDFLAAYNSFLSIVFDHRRLYKDSESTGNSIGKSYSGDNYYISWGNCNWNSSEYNKIASIIGKVLISPYKRPKHEQFTALCEEGKYETFIVGLDDEGKPIECTCNGNELSNNFIQREGKAHFLTPVFFDIKVLDKYKTDPQKYEVGDSDIRYLRDWTIPFSINKDRRVVVWLGDLGRIPYREQIYWKSFNIEPIGAIEERFFARQILNQWTEGSREETNLLFLIEKFNEKIKAGYGDIVFTRLSDTDSEIYNSFIIPTNNSIPEYQQFLMKLSKIVAESINTKLFKQKMGDKYDGGKGSIAQLDDFLQEFGLDADHQLYKSIKLAYDSRNKLSGHRASAGEYNKLWGRDKEFSFNTVEDATSLILGIKDALTLSIDSI